MLLACLGAGSVGALACEKEGVTEVPADAAHTVVSLQELDCQSCGGDVASAIGEAPGVYAAHFQLDSAEVRVAYDGGQLDGPAIVAVAVARGFEAVEGAGKGTYTAMVEFPETMDVQQISNEGEAAELLPHLDQAMLVTAI